MTVREKTWSSLSGKYRCCFVLSVKLPGDNKVTASWHQSSVDELHCPVSQRTFEGSLCESSKSSIVLLCHPPFLTCLLSVITSYHFVYPGAEGGHFGVDAGGLLRPAGVAPGRDPVYHPTPSGTLAHQRTSAVPAATVHTSLRLDAAGAEHAACEGTVEVFVAVAAGQ